MSVILTLLSAFQAFKEMLYAAQDQAPSIEGTHAHTLLTFESIPQRAESVCCSGPWGFVLVKEINGWSVPCSLTLELYKLSVEISTVVLSTIYIYIVVISTICRDIYCSFIN